MANQQYKVELNRSGVRQLLQSQEMEACMRAVAEDVRRNCGSGYEIDTKLMPTRYIASVYTDTYEAMLDNADNNTLLRALS